MSTAEFFDVIHISRSEQIRKEHSDILLKIGKAPLGNGGEFSIGYFFSAHSNQSLPAGVSMYYAGEAAKGHTLLETHPRAVLIELEPLLSTDTNRQKELTQLINQGHQLIAPTGVGFESLIHSGALHLFQRAEEIVSLLKTILKKSSAETKHRDSSVEIAPTPREEPLTFLQINMLYDEFLSGLYTCNPGLEHRTYAEQVERICGHGMAAGHLIAPHLAAHGFKPSVIIANSPHAQLAWLKENEIQIPSGENWNKSIVRIQIETLKPDILYMNDPITFDSRFLSTLSHRPRLIIGWRSAPIPQETWWKGYDLILSNIPGILKLAKELGAKDVQLFSPGYPPAMAEAVSAVRAQYDVVFCGQWTNAHQRRNGYLQHIAKESANPSGPFTFATYLGGARELIPPQIQNRNYGPQFGIDFFRALRSGKICFDTRIDSLYFNHPRTGERIELLGSDAGSMRLFEATGSGAFMLTEHYPALSQYFEIGKEIATFTDQNDLIDKIRYYRSHDTERLEIAVRGQQRCLADHSMTLRGKQMAQIIRTLVGRLTKEDELPWNIDRLTESFSAAVRALQAHDPHTAIKLIDTALERGIPMRDLYYVRGLCCMHLEQWNEACRSFQHEITSFGRRPELEEMLREAESKRV